MSSNLTIATIIYSLKLKLMVVLRTKSQVKNFIKRMTKYYDCYNDWVVNGFSDLTYIRLDGRRGSG